MNDDIIARPLALTDDEVMALAAVSGRAWWTALRTVDVTSEDDMIQAAGRGLRSLAVRSLVNDDGEPDGALALAATCLGTMPWATAASVDEEDRIPGDAPILCLFRGEGDDRLVAVRSDVSGTHLLHELEAEHAIELVATQLSGPSEADFAAAFWSLEHRPHGGLRRRGRECFSVDSDGRELELVGPAGDAAVLTDAVRSYWTA